MKTTLALIALVATSVFAADTPDAMMQNRIRQEGFRNSKVMETAEELMDFVGPRLTGSPNMKRANEWTRDKLTAFGLTNAHLESWGPFGRGWSYEECTVRMTAPDVAQLWALPRAWTPGTNGVITGKPVRVKIETVEDIEKYRGKLAGKIVLNGDAREIKPHEQLQFSRATDKMLADLQNYELPGKPRFTREDIVKRNAFRKALTKFLAEEKPLVMIDSDSADFGNFHVQGAGTQKDGESYPVLEVNVKTTYYDEDKNAYNTIAEIPGSDKKGEIVMLGGHLDSWHGGTGATDNGAGVVVAMEAVRILKAIGIAPKRTIRIALWSGEEEGLLGSRAYVSEHFASRPEPTAAERDIPAAMRGNAGPLTFKPEHAKLSAYFNLDNGTGKIRGIYAQENYAVASIFKSWIEPLNDLGVTTVTERNTGSTDHVSFDGVGLPGFQFIQDEVEYEQRTHHTNYDVYDRLQRDDLMQAAVVMATFVWEAANRPELMPRKPLAKSDLPAASAAAPH
jgi:carboxypeptidase Q